MIKIKKTTLLIVDDDLEICRLIQKSLPNDLYEVIIAVDSNSAIEAFRSFRPDLIMLDVLLPDVDGYETCRRIRNIETERQTPLVFMTSLDDIDSIDKAYEAGATDFLVKPFNPVLLKHKIRFLLKAQNISEELKNTRSQLETAQRVAKMGHWQWTASDNRFSWSEEITQILGLPASQSSAPFIEILQTAHPADKLKIKKAIHQAIEKHSSYKLEHRVVLANAKISTVLQTGKIIFDEHGKASKLVGTLQDITSKKKSENRIKSLSYYNKVTGLPNRTLLKRLLDNYIAASNFSEQSIATLTITLDRFKLITDSYGDAFGENLIKKVAIRLIRSIKESSYFTHKDYNLVFNKKNLDKPLTISHGEGDEFVVVLPKIYEVDEAAQIAKSITKALTDPYQVSGQEIRITASIGISVYPNDGKNTDTLLKTSATALYHAKRQGGDGYKFYTPKMNARAFERLTLETSLRKAIDEKQFVLYYQPKMSISNKKLVGMEALLRWNHPDLGIIAPEEFINILEKTGLIIPLGETIIETACEKIKEWDIQGYKPIPVAINLSPVQLGQKDFHLRLSRIIKKAGINPNMLELEITESTLMNNMEKSITMLKKLRLLGTQISLDDFGTGYSSLTYLKHFPVNTLKIDRSFIQHVTVDADDAAIVRGVIGLAHNMQLNVVAEGIEEQSQLAFLEETGCDYGQGYHYSRPVDVNTFTQLFMEKVTKPSAYLQ